MAKDKTPKKPVDPEVSNYMRKIARVAANRNRQKGSAYFKWVRSHGKQKKKEDE